MTITIPSKNIYSLDFDPVVDNVITKVYTNEYYGSYEQKVFFNETFVGYRSKTSSLSKYITDYDDVSSENPLPLVRGIAGVARTLFLSWEKEVSVFKLAKEWLLYSVTIEKEVDQDINLELSAKCKYYSPVFMESAMTIGEASYSDEKELENQQFTLKEFSSVQAFLDEYFDKTTQPAPYLPDYTVKSLNDSKLLIIGYIPSQNNVTFYFLINKSGYYYDSNEIRSPILATVDVKIYNNVDWQIRSYGTGNKPFVINDSKSKLLQTDTMNGDISQGKYLADAVQSAYGNGKQTAVISCMIADYYNETPIPINILGSQDLAPGYYEYYFNSDYSLSGEYVVINGERLQIYETPFSYDYAFSTTQVLNNGEIDAAWAQKSISKGGENNLPMIFHIGDIVVPYRYTNKGDKPLSRNKDLSPKQFKVVGTKILKRQGVTQELSLQEV